MHVIDLKLSEVGVDKDVLVSFIYVNVGDKIQVNDNIIMIETDKASMDFPACEAGEVTEILVKVGDRLNKNDTILKLSITPFSTVSNKIEMHKDNKLPSNNVNLLKTADYDFSNVHASPSIRRLARELNVDLTTCIGTGKNNRITEEDVRTCVTKEIKTVSLNNNVSSNVDFYKYGEIRIEPKSKIKKISGDNLLRNWISIPHVTQFDEIDISDLEDFRKSINEEYKKEDLRVSILSFLIKANVYALKKFPLVNSSLDGDNIIYKQYFNIGIAVDTDKGLVVPVIKNVDKKGILDIAKEVIELSQNAREGKLKISDMQGGVFTISSLGGVGGSAFTPIINSPEVAILGVSKSSIKPVWQDNAFIPRLILPISFSYDHRVIDGVLAAKYTTYLADIMKDIRKLIL